MSALIAKNITKARIYGGLTKKELGDRVDISAQAISQYENGSRVPQPDILSRIADALEVPLAFFHKKKECEIITHTPVFHRAKANQRTSSKYLRRTEIALEVVEYYRWLNRYVELPAPFQADEFSANPEEAADQLRESWGLGSSPIGKFATLLEAKGIIIVDLTFPDADITDGCSGFFDGRPFIFTNVEQIDAARTRFTMAHELGHIILHSHLTEEDLSNPATYKEVESEADAFASAFLMPEDTFGTEVYSTTLNGLLQLKPRWGVSVAAMIMRSYQIGRIDEERKSSLFKQLSYRGWRKNEPLNQQVVFDAPKVGKSALTLLLEADPSYGEKLLCEQNTLFERVQRAFRVERKLFAFAQDPTPFSVHLKAVK